MGKALSPTRRLAPGPPGPSPFLKTLRDSELLCRSVFTLRPPDLLRCERFFERKNVCNSQDNLVRTRYAAIVNHYAIVNLLRRANLLRRSIFSTAGSFGLRSWCCGSNCATGVHSFNIRSTWNCRMPKGSNRCFSDSSPRLATEVNPSLWRDEKCQA